MNTAENQLFPLCCVPGLNLIMSPDNPGKYGLLSGNMEDVVIKLSTVIHAKLNWNCWHSHITNTFIV